MADEQETREDAVEEAATQAEEAIADVVDELTAAIPEAATGEDRKALIDLKEDVKSVHEELIDLRKNLEALLPQPETGEESASDEGDLSEAETPEVAVLDEVVPEPPARKKFIPGRRRR